MHSKIKQPVLLFALWALLSGFSFLDEVARKVEQGNRHFDAAEFQAALEAYREAQTDRPDAPELHYNVGDALYKQGAIEEAMAAYQKAIETGDADLGAKAYYNLGNALYRQKAFDKAVESYEKSLELNPADEDAKINLEMALEQLENQQKQQGQDQQNKDQQDQEDQQEQDSENQDSNPDEDEKPPQDNQDQDGNENENQQDPPKPDQPQDQQDPQQQGSQEGQEQQAGELSPEEAERLLDAMKDREAESQKRRRIRLQGKRYRGKPW